MEKDKLVETLKALASSNARTETARLRDVFEQVESALSAGVKRVDVLESLHGHGFSMTLRTFESSLYRIRKERHKNVPQCRNTSVRIAGFDVTSPSRIAQIKSEENELLK